MSAIAAQLPANVKLMTISSNYAKWNAGKLILRLSHLFSVGEHPTLSLPATVDLAAVFAKTGLKLKSMSETMLTGAQCCAVGSGGGGGGGGGACPVDLSHQPRTAPKTSAGNSTAPPAPAACWCNTRRPAPA